MQNCVRDPFYSEVIPRNPQFQRRPKKESKKKFSYERGAGASILIDSGTAFSFSFSFLIARKKIRFNDVPTGTGPDKSISMLKHWEQYSSCTLASGTMYNSVIDLQDLAFKA